MITPYPLGPRTNPIGRESALSRHHPRPLARKSQIQEIMNANLKPLKPHEVSETIQLESLRRIDLTMRTYSPKLQFAIICNIIQAALATSSEHSHHVK
jgi:hypothetical protein